MTTVPDPSVHYGLHLVDDDTDTVRTLVPYDQSDGMRAQFYVAEEHYVPQDDEWVFRATSRPALYRIVNVGYGSDVCLDATESKVVYVNPADDNALGQFWRLTPVDGTADAYRLSTLLYDDDMCLDFEEDREKEDREKYVYGALAPVSRIPVGRSWRLTAVAGVDQASSAGHAVGSDDEATTAG